MVLEQGKTLAQINERCANRAMWIKSVDEDVRVNKEAIVKLTEMTDRTDRNVIRLVAHAGLNDPIEQKGD